MAPPDASLVLAPSPRRWLLILATSLGFVAVGAALYATDTAPAIASLACGVFFALSALVAAVQLVPGLNGLAIAADGFTMQTFGRRHRFGWDEIDGTFRVVTLSPTAVPLGPSQILVGFDLNGPGAQGRLARMNKSLYDIHEALPDTYGMTPEGLADLLNDRLAAWRASPG